MAGPFCAFCGREVLKVQRFAVHGLPRCLTNFDNASLAGSLYAAMAMMHVESCSAAGGAGSTSVAATATSGNEDAEASTVGAGGWTGTLR